MPSTQDSSVPSRHAVVIGAGIGGLTAAIALRRAGFGVAVHERAPAIKPVGAGLTIQPNAILALRRLGVAEPIERLGAHLIGGGLYRADGRPLAVLPAAAARAVQEEIGAPMIGIHRGTLHEILLDALGREHVHLGRACTGYALDGARATALFEGAEPISAEVLVGADGLHSALRKQFLHDGEPVHAGYTCWRGVTTDRAGFAPDWGGEVWTRTDGHSVRFGGCAIDGGRFYWFAVASAPAGGTDAPGAAKARVLALFKGAKLPIEAAIAATPDDHIVRHDIADRPPQTRWGEGAMTLLGDAAHPMTPNFGQGACQAIEDALFLGEALGGANAARPVAESLRAYEAFRQPRANGIVVGARRFGAMGHWNNPVAVWLRNGLFRAMPARALRKRLAGFWRLPA